MSTMAEISRRRFLQAMGVVGASSAFALAGCGAQRASDQAAGSTSGEGGIADTITFAQGADPRGLDPAYVDDGESAKIMCNIYDTLLRYDTESCDVVAGLAEMPEVSEDGLTYTFKLHEGVKFHDGTDCNAAAREGIHRPSARARPHRGHALRVLRLWLRGQRRRCRLRRGSG